MKKQLAIAFLAGIAITLVAVLGMDSGRVEAAAPALTLNPETGLPTDSLVFRVEDHTCIVLSGGEVECFCSCSSEVCGAQMGVIPLLSSGTTTNGMPVTLTVWDTSGILVSEQEPDQEPAEPFDGDEPNGNNGNDDPKGNNGLGNGEDPPPPGIDKQGKPQNDQPAVPGEPRYRGSGSDGQPNGRGDSKGNKHK